MTINTLQSFSLVNNFIKSGQTLEQKISFTYYRFYGLMFSVTDNWSNCIASKFNFRNILNFGETIHLVAFYIHGIRKWLSIWHNNTIN